MSVEPLSSQTSHQYFRKRQPLGDITNYYRPKAIGNTDFRAKQTLYFPHPNEIS
jgi:hypothetical protein